MSYVTLVPPIFVNIKSYGAVGDGVTDDTTAINNALAALPTATGGVLYTPPNMTCLISSPINISSYSNNLVILGGGWSSCWKLANGTNDYIIKATSGSMQGARVQYMKFDCNGSNQTAASGGLHGYKWRRCLIEHCWFHNFYETGIFLEGTGGDFGYQNDIKSCFIEGGYGQAGKGRGLYLLYTDENTVSDNLFQNNGGSDTSAGDNMHIRDDNGLTTYKGNKFVNGRGVFHLYGLQCRIIGNIFDGNGGACIQVLSNAKDTIIEGNTFLNVGYIASGGSNNSVDAIYVADTQCTITGNWFQSSSGSFPYTNSFIKIDTGATYLQVGHNQFNIPSGSGTVTPMIFVSGIPTGCRIETSTGLNSVTGNAINDLATYNVKSYGATGDGSTDDSTSIANAVTAAGNAGGGTVFLPPGTYLTTTITLPNRVRLVGAGMHATIIKLKNTTNSHVIQNYVSPDGIIANAQHVAVMDLMIDGNKANQSGTSHGIYFTVFPLTSQATNDDDFDSQQLIQNVYIKNVLTDGYNGSGRAANMLKNIQTYACGRYGINPGFDHWLTDCNVGQSGSEGYYLNASEIHLTNCASFYSGQSSTSSGFHCTSSAYEVNLSNCIAQDNTGTGFQLDTTSNVILAGCLADSNSTSSAGTYPAVDVWNSTGCIVDVACIERKADGVHSYQTHALQIRSSSSGNQFRLTHTATNSATISDPIMSSSNSLAGNDININTANGYQSPAYAATVTPNPYSGNVIEITLTGNITINVPSTTVHPGCQMTFVLIQDATGGRTMTFGAGYKTSWTPSTTASKTNTIRFVYDGTNWIQIAAQTGL